jgi:glutathione S-transferase
LDASSAEAHGELITETRRNAAMEVYFSPLACSLATRISLYEAGAAAVFHEIDAKSRKTLDGKDLREINPLGQVPTLRTDDGDIIAENAAILQYVAGQFPDAALAPTDGMARVRLQQWLCFIGTELHKVVFQALLDAKAPEGAKTYALEKAAARLDVLERHLTGREFLLDQFSVADAYLVTILNWTIVTPIDLAKWPAVAAYAARLRQRPSVKRALAEEGRLYAEEQARHKQS